MKLLIIAALLCLPIAVSAQTILSGTTVVAVRTPSEIFVGADSKIAVIGDTLSDGGQACKIVQVDNLFFAHAGLLRDSQGMFNISETLFQARRKGGAILDTANNFEQMIIPSLTAALEQIKHNHPVYFQQHLDGKPAISVVLFGIEKGVPVLYLRYFVASSSDNKLVTAKVQRLNCPGDCPTGMTYGFLGHHNALDRFLDANPHYSRNGWIPTINKLIEIEAEHNPDLVSLPIDILHLDKTGAKWLQKKPSCVEIRK